MRTGDYLDFNTTVSTQMLPPHKRFLFVCVLLLLPFFSVGMLEAVLRLAGFGGYPPIIQPVGPVAAGTLAITESAGAATYFFANPDRPGYNEQYSFLTPKPPNTIRIFLVGESAIKGFPQPRNLACSAFLQQMLQDAWPDRAVEVINLGTTAVASFPVLEIMTEALAYQPDLIVIYTGHNEFFGTYGTASIGRAGSRPWMLRATRWVHSLALVQVVEKLLPAPRRESNRTLMETMIGKSYVAPDDWSRQAAARNLHANIAAMLERCRARGVPVLVCTQPTNERDLAPVGTDKTDSLDATRQREFARLLEEGMNASRKNPTQAAAVLQQALGLLPQHARAHYYLAQACLAVGESEKARDHFIRARDLDPLPWRCTSQSQEAILRAAKESGVPVCDVEKAFHDGSPDGLIGWELMDDHVHPTLRGQALIAEAIVASLQKFSGPLRVSAQARERLPGWEEYARRCGDNSYDRYGVAHQMRVIFDIEFMRRTNPDAYSRFNAIASRIEQESDPEIQTVLREWQTVKPHAGGKRPLSGMVARVLMRQKKFAEALELFLIAQKAIPDYPSWHLEYVYFALACQEKLNGHLSVAEREQALAGIRQGEFLLRRGFSETGFTERYVGRLHQLRGEYHEAIPYLLASRTKLGGFDLVAADQALVVSYIQTKQFDRARELAAYGAKNSGQYAALYQAMLDELPNFERAAATNAVPAQGSTLTR